MSGSRKLATSAIWTGFEKQSTVTGEGQGRPGKTLSSAMLKSNKSAPGDFCSAGVLRHGSAQQRAVAMVLVAYLRELSVHHSTSANVRE
jgi:hypothetical protein